MTSIESHDYIQPKPPLEISRANGYTVQCYGGEHFRVFTDAAPLKPPVRALKRQAARHFRVFTDAAPLKLPAGQGHAARPHDFRVFTDAAPLKLGQRAPLHAADAHFRVFTDAAPLKSRGPCAVCGTTIQISASSPTRPH